MPTIHDRAVAACRRAVIACADFRVHNLLRSGIVLEPADIFTLPGAALSIVHPETIRARASFFRKVAFVVAAHHGERLHIYAHTDCAAYGGREAFENADVEGKALWGDLVKARELIMAHPALRNLDVKLGIILTGTTEVLHF